MPAPVPDRASSVRRPGVGRRHFAAPVEPLEQRVLLSADPFLAASGTVIRDAHGTGHVVQLHGTNPGGWLVTEGWMTPRDSSGLPDDFSARQTLINRFGAATADNLTNAYEDAWLTTKDLDNIKALGINVVRLPFWYRNLENEDGMWRADAFDHMDWLVNNCAARGIYVILDFHGVVGGQSTAESTGKVRSSAEFWTSTVDQRRTVDIWQQIAGHFNGNPYVAGYDLLNEPTGAPSQIALWNMYDRLYHAVRAADPDHMIFMEGTWGSWDWDMLPAPSTFGWTNVAYEMHEYQFSSFSNPAAVQAGTDRQVNDFRAHQSWNVPCLIGEFNDFGPGPSPANVWKYTINKFDANHMSWIEWAYKSTRGSAPDSWGIYDPTSRAPGAPNLQTNTAAAIQTRWSAYTTANVFALNPMLRAALPVPGPRVSQVLVSGSTWTVPPYAIPSGTSQAADLGWVNVDQVQLSFNEPVNVLASDLILSGSNGTIYAVNGFRYDPATQTALWTLAAPLPAGGVQLSLSGVTDADGLVLDGEWTDGASAFPSGNGTSGGDFVFHLNVLPGDTDADGVVNFADLVSLARNYGHPGGIAEGDLNGDGNVGFDDLVALARQLSTHRVTLL